MLRVPGVHPLAQWIYRLIQNAVQVGPVPYEQLVHPEKPPPPYVGVT